MAGGWMPSQFRGVRYREDAKRKHGVKADRYFAIRYKLDGKTKEEGVGWASEGMTAAKANETRAMLMANIRAGMRPQSLAEMRDMAERVRREEERAAKLEERRSTTFAEFWESDYLPSCNAKTARTVGYETGMARKWLFPAIGEIPLQSLTPAMLQAIAIQAQKEGKSPATVTKVLGIVSQVWNLAAARGVVAGDRRRGGTIAGCGSFPKRKPASYWTPSKPVRRTCTISPCFLSLPGYGPGRFTA